ncbi:Fe-Mn family superoxide dismutase [Dongia deserti]|uniref:Fe-Mn family superoxide dismutase n=1 Tax=Dongia deserti TaxID=2268030 RepID=UPI002548FD9F|nr:Fe-Mn family superoxide dismutase [Dongia deserti]
MMASHYENNYGGALRRLNAIEAKLSGVDWDKAAVFEINGLKREQLIAANSVILHEVYFDGLGGDGSDPSGSLAEHLERDFGSVEAWKREFIAMGRALAGGSGWVLLTWSARLGRLVNQWSSDHAHCLSGGQPILALDMYEHAYHVDFGAKAAAYVDAFMANIHWGRVAERHGRAMEAPHLSSETSREGEAITVEELRDMLARNGDVVVLDVRLADDLANGTDILLSAQYRDPARLEQWAKDLPKDRLVIVYCVYGFQVSGDAAAALRQRGFNARNLTGGIAAWHAIGGPTMPKS